MESPCSNDEGDEFECRRGTNSSFLMRMASSPTPTHLAATAEHEERGHEAEEGDAAGNSNSELTRPSQGGIGSNG